MSVEFTRKFSPSELGYKIGHLFDSPQACLSASEILYDGNPIAQAEFFVEASKAWEVSMSIQAEIAKGIEDTLLDAKGMKHG
tara:strand:- start:343 stop:588 length:246 start_codon:yes stop_codon:yes gene_type:complete